MPTSDRPTSPLAARIASIPRRHDNDNPLWRGPCDPGPLGGITQSMLVRFLSCRERFRLKYILGLEPPDRWNHRLGYGNMWHACEEALAGEVRTRRHAACDHCGAISGNGTGYCEACGGDLRGLCQCGRRCNVFEGTCSYCSSPEGKLWRTKLTEHTQLVCQQYPLQRDEIIKWHNVCAVQFPEYVKYWADHPDVLNREPLMQEQVFDVPYVLPSGRTVRLRGKWDSVDLIDGGVYLQENKTKGDIDKIQVERQLRFDLQTMLYLVALDGYKRYGNMYEHLRDVGALNNPSGDLIPIRGVRYNVVRRPLSGGRGSITPHKARYTKNKATPAETQVEFFERLRRDYIAADPSYWFFRVRAEISARDLKVFCNTCLDPMLETVCWWYDTEIPGTSYDLIRARGFPPMNYRTPFGVYSALEEGGATEYDAYLDTGSEAGLRRVETLFTELQE